MAARVISAIAGGATEALGAAVVNVSCSHDVLNPSLHQNQDLFFLHERGGKMGIYMIALSTGNAIGPLINGFIVTGTPHCKRMMKPKADESS